MSAKGFDTVHPNGLGGVAIAAAGGLPERFSGGDAWGRLAGDGARGLIATRGAVGSSSDRSSRGGEASGRTSPSSTSISDGSAVRGGR